MHRHRFFNKKWPSLHILFPRLVFLCCLGDDMSCFRNLCLVFRTCRPLFIVFSQLIPFWHPYQFIKHSTLRPLVWSIDRRFVLFLPFLLSFPNLRVSPSLVLSFFNHTAHGAPYVKYDLGLRCGSFLGLSRQQGSSHPLVPLPGYRRMYPSAFPTHSIPLLGLLFGHLIEEVLYRH